MKLISKSTLLAAMLATISVGAFAADSVDLKVIGTIVPASCTPTLAGGGVIDYGNIPAASLSDTGFTTLADKTSSLTITCDQPAKVSVKVIDDRSGTAPAGAIATGDQYAYGLGAVNSKNVGAYSITFPHATATADGTTPDGVYSDNGGSTWGTLGVTDAHINAGGNNQIAWTVSGGTAPQAYSVITQGIVVSTKLNSRPNQPDLTNDVPLDGLATFSLVYL
ncbi:DUF1120 domain-containing protein [Paraburkholderia gardini]|jgi:type 1 fimbria pilin|uniref:DUF1120 domain-containing protein n=1 Tax=Paraburkholderia gardini TaxID=2823469 RepID=A0ABM8U5Q8_9BURK|nr:DUF1120 domain-containing protein [Paraburkholderia gardini]CAG4905885.1 hypothetical protein R54767_03245 [Paraburkholderia gardini]